MKGELCAPMCVMLLYLRLQKEGCPLQGCVLVGAEAVEVEVRVTVPLREVGMVRREVVGRREPVRIMRVASLVVVVELSVEVVEEGER